MQDEGLLGGLRAGDLEGTATARLARYELRLAVKDLSARGLKLASKW
jgi:hypothetical protein